MAKIERIAGAVVLLTAVVGLLVAASGTAKAEEGVCSFHAECYVDINGQQHCTVTAIECYPFSSNNCEAECDLQQYVCEEECKLQPDGNPLECAQACRPVWLACNQACIPSI